MKKTIRKEPYLDLISPIRSPRWRAPAAASFRITFAGLEALYSQPIGLALRMKTSMSASTRLGNAAALRTCRMLHG